MSLENKIMDEMKAAMKAKDQGTLSALRAIKSAILLAKTDKAAGDLDEASEVQLLQKLVKQRMDAAEIYAQQGRDDLYGEEVFQAEVIKKFMPEMMSDDELKKQISQIITELGASGPSDMGKVMGAATGRLKGKAENSKIASTVKELLSH